MSSLKKLNKPKRRSRGPYFAWMSKPDAKEPRVSEWRSRNAEAGDRNTAAAASDSWTADESDTSVGEEVPIPCNVESDIVYDIDIVDSDAPDSGEETADRSMSCVHETNTEYSSCNDNGTYLEPFEEQCSPYCRCSNCSYADDEEFSLCSDFEDNADDDCNGKDQHGMSKEGEDLPLYAGARLTLMTSMLLILSFLMKHGLTADAFADLLVLVELHCISPNVFKKTTKLFTQFFKELRSPIEFHYYCTHANCFTYLGQTRPQVCPTCSDDLTVKKNYSYFVVVPIAYQLQSLFNEHLLQDILNLKASQKRKKDSSICDVLDGNLYKENFDDDGYIRGSSPVKNEIHISFQVNTDGVSIFRSSNFSVWPVYLIINELPHNYRFTRKHRLFIGLWFGKEKPFFKTFMKPFAQSLKDLLQKGTEVVIGAAKWRIRAILLCGVFDAPARCCFQEMVQYNGFYGCPFCESAGETFKTSERGSTHVYPFNTSSVTGHGKTRTHQKTVTHARNADSHALEGKAAPEYGVKGTTWFMFLPKFDIIRGVGIDYMHCVLLGVMKMLMHLWFDKQYRTESFSISSKMKDVNQRLQSIKPPNLISRIPRTLEDIGHYKASEYKSFLLYYGLPCLFGILPDDCYQHFLLLVHAVFLLLQESITESELKQASILLKNFCLNLPVHYGRRYETSNLHMLLHLVEKVRDLGPLWCQSCFYFEDFNGELRKLFHGTQSIEQQITLAVSINQKLPQLEKFLTYGTGAHELYLKLTHKRRRESNQRQYLLLDNIKCIGAMKSFAVTGEDKTAIERQVGQLRDVQKFKRISVAGQVMHSEDYRNVMKRNSCTVVTGDGHIYQIKYYVKVNVRCPNPIFCKEYLQCVCRIPHYLAVAHLLEKVQVRLSSDTITHATAGHIVPVKHRKNVTVAVPLNSFISCCVFISYGGNVDFVCKLPNLIERE